MKELFNVDLSFPGVIKALNYAFKVSKSVVPVKTGLMLRSFTMEKISKTTVRCFFDPKKIIGQKRLGRIVKEYYPQYLVDTPKRFNWLHIVIRKFYNALKLQMEQLAKKHEEIKMENFFTFMVLLLVQQQELIEQEKKRLELQEKKKKEIEEKRKAFLKSLRNGGK